MDGFLAYDCNDDLATRPRREVHEANGAGYDCFEFNTSVVTRLRVGN
jgi:hypothetical protein